MEKAFDSVPRDDVWWALRKLGVKEWLVTLYRNAGNRVRVSGTFSYDFLVQVGLHQDPVSNVLLSVMVLEVLSREIKSGYPEELLYADDLALVCETHEGLKGRLEACD